MRADFAVLLAPVALRSGLALIPVGAGSSFATFLVRARLLAFAGGEIVNSLDDEELTHIIVSDDRRLQEKMRKAISSRRRIPHVVRSEWVIDSWDEQTRLEEERE